MFMCFVNAVGDRLEVRSWRRSYACDGTYLLVHVATCKDHEAAAAQLVKLPEGSAAHDTSHNS